MILPKKARLLFFLAAFALGLMSINLFKVSLARGSISTRQDTALPSLIQTEQENKQLNADNVKMRKELAKYYEGQNVSNLVSQQLKEAQVNAGLTQVKGPGIRIVLDDAGTKERKDEDLYYYVIHEEYIRQLVNWLWNGGAEAVAVNGQRITSSTEVFCSGAFIQINQTRQMPPYIIEAVGDVRNLQSALNFYFWDRLGEYQQKYGITRKLEVPNKPLVIPAGQPQKFHFAEPVKGG